MAQHAWELGAGGSWVRGSHSPGVQSVDGPSTSVGGGCPGLAVTVWRWSQGGTVDLCSDMPEFVSCHIAFPSSV